MWLHVNNRLALVNTIIGLDVVSQQKIGGIRTLYNVVYMCVCVCHCERERERERERKMERERGGGRENMCVE